MSWSRAINTTDQLWVDQFYCLYLTSRKGCHKQTQKADRHFGHVDSIDCWRGHGEGINIISDNDTMNADVWQRWWVYRIICDKHAVDLMKGHVHLSALLSDILAVFRFSAVTRKFGFMNLLYYAYFVLTTQTLVLRVEYNYIWLSFKYASYEIDQLIKKPVLPGLKYSETCLKRTPCGPILLTALDRCPL